MKNLFNNAWFVTGLGIAAMGTVFGSVLVSMSDDLEGTRPVAGLYADDGAAADDDPDVGTAMLRDRIGWLANPSRDPFAPQAGYAVVDTQPVLKALFVGRRASSAVIDQSLVRVGDRVRGYRVASIDHSGVVLATEHLVLRLEPST